MGPICKFILGSVAYGEIHFDFVFKEVGHRQLKKCENFYGQAFFQNFSLQKIGDLQKTRPLNNEKRWSYGHLKIWKF